MRASTRTLILLLAAIAGAWLPSYAAHASDIYLVFDGSGSMWGKLEGSKDPKFVAAREALRQVLPRLPAETRIALSAFGHRRRGDCSDVEQIVAPEKLNVDKLIAPLEKLNPKGKGPLVQALRETAKLAGDNTDAQIVLVHDSADNCQQDPCAAAAEIAKQSPRLRIHTLGIALENDDGAKMTCIAKTTGGRQFEAPDQPALEKAVDDIMRLAALSTPASPATKPQTPSRPSAAAPTTPAPDARPIVPTTEGPPRVQLAAVLGNDKAVLSEPVEWRLLNANGEAVIATAAAQVDQPVPAGTYRLEARIGRLVQEQKIDVAAKGSTVTRVVFDAGLVSLAARPYKEATPFQDVVWSIVPAGGGAANSGLITRDSTVNLVLPAGAYKVAAERGLAIAEQALTVEAGGRHTVDIMLSSGDLEVSAAASDESDILGNVVFIVSEDDPEAPQGRREIARSAASRPYFQLAAGTYYVTARSGIAEVRQRLAVGAGDVVKRTLVLGTTRVQVAAPLQKPLDGQPLLVKAIRIDGEPKEVARTREANAELLLAPGRYRIEATAGGHNVRSERTIEVKPGKPQQVALAFAAGQVTLKPAGVTGFAETFWEVRDGQGKLVLRSAQAETKAVLAAGRYVARLESRDRQAERAFEIRPGELLPLEVKVD